ncbi:MAG: U32 family peptidase, partial [Planctomycetes bacterium]|nr:U32 family peptidase [Planctomycetota bacterium]
RAAECGVDALIVQDPAVALLARELCPALEVHASTQMTISSPEAARFAASLGVTRIVVPRELSVEEIRAFARGTELELEVFIHGALCVAWSGQCLSSATWSGRSANRGECAQSCRLPYDLVVDGERRELGDVKYLLSPKDLAGLRAVEQLVDIGVHGLKIEGRQKNAQYVLTATEMYRRFVDRLGSTEPGSTPARSTDDVENASLWGGRAGVEPGSVHLLRTSLAYTRGFSDGFLGGSDHQTLVEGRFPKHRGVYLGRVAHVGANTVVVVRDDDGRPWTGALAAEARSEGPQGAPSAALQGLGGSSDASDGPRAAELEPRAGLGVVFDAGEPENPNEPGGPIFRVDAVERGWRLGFGVPGPDLARVAVGMRVWVSGDPALAREAERAVAAPEPTGRIAVDLVVRGGLGAPLEVEARARHARARATSTSMLERSQGRGLDERLLAEKLAGFGGTPFRLGRLDRAKLHGGLHLPVSELKALRRALVEELLPQIERGTEPGSTPARSIAVAETASLRGERAGVEPGSVLVALCRDDAQLEAAIDAGLREVELDWMELVGLARAVERARAAKLRITLATVRVQKPGEEGYDQRLAALAPDAVLVRHWGALVHFQEHAREHGRPLLHGDFSLNVTNSRTARELFARGLDTLTPAHDLDREQLFALCAASDPSRFTIPLQHRIPTFHTEHCVYAHLLSQGRDFRTCRRPCEHRRVALRDLQGREHPVIVDVGCRNTVFNAEVQSSAELAPELLARGVRRFRVEFVRESRAEAAEVLRAYGDLLAGRVTPREALARAGAAARVGVGDAMAVMR